jgi:hypothetical protein
VPHRTSPVKFNPTVLFEVGTINRSLPTPLSYWPLRKSKSFLEIQILSSSSSVSKIQTLNPCSWEKIRAPLWVSHPIQERALHPLPRQPRLCLLLLGIKSPRWLGVTWELPGVVGGSREVCIALLSVGIDSEEPGWPWWQLGRIRAERDLTLFGLLNGDVGNLFG